MSPPPSKYIIALNLFELSSVGGGFGEHWIFWRWEGDLVILDNQPDISLVQRNISNYVNVLADTPLEASRST